MIGEYSYATFTQGHVCYDCFRDEEKNTREGHYVCVLKLQTCAEYKKSLLLPVVPWRILIRSVRSEALCVTMKMKCEERFATRVCIVVCVECFFLQ